MATLHQHRYHSVLRWGFTVLALGLATQAYGEQQDLLPRLERQQREATQRLRREQRRATNRTEDVRNTREQARQSILHEQQRRDASVPRRSAERTGTSRPSRTSTNTRLQQYGRQESSQSLRNKITR